MPSSTPRSRRYILMDVAERTIIVSFFSVLVWNIVAHTPEDKDLTSLFLLLSEMTPAVFILFRRHSQEVSSNPAVWLIGMLGTGLPMLAVPTGDGSLAPAVLTVWLTLFGFIVQVSAKFTLRRSFGVVAANRGVKVGGPYRLVRHPMYAGYVIAQLGFLLANPSAWNFSLYVVATAFQIARIRAEEKVLNRDPAYQQFVLAVPYRLCPYVY